MRATAVATLFLAGTYIFAAVACGLSGRIVENNLVRAASAASGSGLGPTGTSKEVNPNAVDQMQANPSSVSGPGAGLPAHPKNIEIDLDVALKVAIPRTGSDLQPAVFKTSDGHDGWVVRVPGARPIATPAYADGLLFVGGGYGSHEFYAFHADTGELAWKIRTSDDGPTAAVVEDGYVAFNTESCTVVVVEERTGKIVWQEWLGDPLMSQPAIADGRLFMAYPAGGGKGSQYGHRLLAADLKTGKHLWAQEITADVISAPVVSAGVVYLTCFDGTSFAIQANDGKILWRKAQAATSAPLVTGGNVVVTLREQNGASVNEGIARLDVAKGVQRDKELLAEDKAEYLTPGNSGGIALNAAAQQQLDSSVGFATAPAAAKLKAAESNVGVNNVVGAWAYQGSRAAYSGGQMLNAQGHMLNSIRAADGVLTWRAKAKSTQINDHMQVFSPPAIGGRYMYLTSSLGHILAVRQKDGSVQFAYSLGTPMNFQPALARGNVYAGTTQGLLLCLKTGNNDADGWYEWGGNAQHNK